MDASVPLTMRRSGPDSSTIVERDAGMAVEIGIVFKGSEEKLKMFSYPMPHRAGRRKLQDILFAFLMLEYCLLIAVVKRL